MTKKQKEKDFQTIYHRISLCEGCFCYFLGRFNKHLEKKKRRETQVEEKSETMTGIEIFIAFLLSAKCSRSTSTTLGRGFNSMTSNLKMAAEG